MEELSQLAEYGLAGISISLVILVGFILNRVFKFMGNHINHNTDAWNKNTEALTCLTEIIKRDIEAQKDTAETIRQLQNKI